MKYKVRYGTISCSLLHSHRPRDIQIQALEERKQFFSKLERSIRIEGLRNPIHVAAYEDQLEVKFGCCRLYVAKKIGIEEMPCIISDYVNQFPNFELLISADDILAKFKDRPSFFRFTDEELIIENCPHIHLEMQ